MGGRVMPPVSFRRRNSVPTRRPCLSLSPVASIRAMHKDERMMTTSNNKRTALIFDDDGNVLLSDRHNTRTDRTTEHHHDQSSIQYTHTYSKGRKEKEGRRHASLDIEP